MTSPQPLESRLAQVERMLAELSAEVAALRAEMPAADARARQTADRSHETNSPPRHAPGPSVPPTTSPRRTRLGADITAQDIERLLGRYGMLAIAVLAAAAAVGTFLSWAISRGYLHFHPAVRVLIGLAFAAGICAWGLRLRRTERSFGSSLVGLALVIVHVCAYAAGPGFQLVPTIVAFAGAAAASWVLALSALHENDEPLWCVGVGGASIAPFVTSDGRGSVYALLAYGLLVTIPASLAISHREWPVAWRVFYAATALFAVAGASLAGTHGAPGVMTALAFPFVIAAAGVIPFAPDTRKRGVLRWLLALGLVVALTNHLPIRGASSFFAAWLIGAACVALLFADRHAHLPQSSMFTWGRTHRVLLDWLDAAVIPLCFVAEVAAAGMSRWAIVTTYAIGVAAFSVFSWRRAVGPLRDASAAAAVAMAAALVGALPLGEPVERIAGYLLVALAALAMHVRRPSRGWLAMGLGVLALAMTLSATSLLDRTSYQFSPFMTRASIGALLVTGALIVVSRGWQTLFSATHASIPDRPRRTYASGLSTMARALTLAPWIWAFLWGMMELAMAYSPSTSTLLLVTYFASTGVGCVAAGRARRVPRLRHTGLALALLAAGTAIYGASSYFGFGARIAAYLVTSAFLLGIAYWYRRPGAERAAA
jgi:hypothetical protein